MKYDSQFVEIVVREVLRRLAVADACPAPATGEPTLRERRELVLTERLVTLATLQGRLDDVARLVVARRAVVSPAVHDELRAKNIELRRI
jgi:hypothetical protein